MNKQKKRKREKRKRKEIGKERERKGKERERKGKGKGKGKVKEKIEPKDPIHSNAIRTKSPNGIHNNNRKVKSCLTMKSFQALSKNVSRGFFPALLFCLNISPKK